MYGKASCPDPEAVHATTGTLLGLHHSLLGKLQLSSLDSFDSPVAIWVLWEVWFVFYRRPRKNFLRRIRHFLKAYRLDRSRATEAPGNRLEDWILQRFAVSDRTVKQSANPAPLRLKTGSFGRVRVEPPPDKGTLPSEPTSRPQLLGDTLAPYDGVLPAALVRFL